MRARDPFRLRVAATVALAVTAIAPPALAAGEQRADQGMFRMTSASEPGSMTAAGLQVAPGYLGDPGEFDLSCLLGVVSLPRANTMLGGHLSLQARLTDNLVLLADGGPISTLGVRGPLWDSGPFTLGWDARYRAESYPARASGMGLAALPALGPLRLAAGSIAQGGLVAANLGYQWNDLAFYASPLAQLMSNRLAAGLALGADYRVAAFVLGVGAEFQQNLVDPAQATLGITPFESRYHAGMRYELTDKSYLQARYQFVPADTYGFSSHTILAGLGTRWTVAPAAPGGRISLKGRLFHSLMSGGHPGRPLTVSLKRASGNGWISAPQTTKTDASGNYHFMNLPAGTYEVTYRDEGLLANQAGAVVSEPVTVAAGRTPRVVMDLAWDESKFVGRLANRTVSVAYPAKPGFAPVSYETILKYAPEQPYVAGSPQTDGLTTSMEVSSEIAANKLYYTVKYWRQGGQFEGANYYGQSRYKLLGTGR